MSKLNFCVVALCLFSRFIQKNACSETQNLQIENDTFEMMEFNTTSDVNNVFRSSSFVGIP